MRTSEERLSAFVSVIVKPKQMTDSGSDELFSAEVQLADYRSASRKRGQGALLPVYGSKVARMNYKLPVWIQYSI